MPRTDTPFSHTSFGSTLLQLAVPIALQQLIFSSLNLVTIMMIGQLGEVPVAAVGLGNQIFFLFQLMLFGLSSGCAIFIAQYWGKRDLLSIHRVLGICLAVGLLGSIAFTYIAVVIPELALGIYSSDPAVIALGSDYLRLVGWAYVFFAVTTAFSVTLRSTGNVRLPFAVSTFALSLGAALNYSLIFGQFGLPALGVQGSAIGTVIARVVECGLLLFFAYWTRSAAAAPVSAFARLDLPFVHHIFRTALPVLVNEILWSIGISAYNIAYGHIGTEAVAAVSICASIEAIAFVPFQGLSNAAAIMIGHRIGATEERHAVEYAHRCILLSIFLGILIGGLVYLSADYALDLYQIGSASRELARTIMTIVSLFIWVKVCNMMLIVGILRAGGDTRIGFLIDVGPLWLIGLPSAILGAFYFGLPAYLVYLLAMSDEATKMVIATWRMLSKRWVNNLVRSQAEGIIAS